MAIYHFSVQRNSRASGRTAVGAAAYRAMEKLHCEYDGVTHNYTHRRSAVSAAAYRSGESLQHENTTHDFTIKGGIVHSEIMLPSHALRKYQDRGTLWNAVEAVEKQWNAQTFREIVIALPNELSTEQKIKLVQDYVRENFVNEGMCADINIHSGRHKHTNQAELDPDQPIAPDNPHAHIQLTVRPLNEDGTWGAKSKKEYILDKNGDRIKLKSGKGWKSRHIDTTDWEKPETLEKWRENWALTVNKEFERLGIDEHIDHRTLKAQGIDREPTIHIGVSAKAMERRGIKTEKGNINREIRTRNEAKTPENIANSMHELKKNYVILDKKIAELRQKSHDVQREINSLQFKVEQITERAEQIHTKGKRIDELKTQRNSMGGFASKKAIDQQIQRLERSHEQARNYFKQEHKIAPEQATAVVKRLEFEAKDMERIHEQLQDSIIPLVADKDAFEIEYMRLKLLAEISPDGQKIYDRLNEIDGENRQQGQSVRDNIAWRQNERRLEQERAEHLNRSRDIERRR